MKTPFEKEPHFDNENTYRKKHILRMEAHSEMYFENENMFLEKWKVINTFF